MVIFKLQGGDIVTLKPGDIIEYGSKPLGKDLEVVVNTRSPTDGFDENGWYLAWDLDEEEHAKKIVELIWSEIGRQKDSPNILIDMADIIERARSMI